MCDFDGELTPFVDLRWPSWVSGGHWWNVLAVVPSWVSDGLRWLLLVIVCSSAAVVDTILVKNKKQTYQGSRCHISSPVLLLLLLLSNLSCGDLRWPLLAVVGRRRVVVWVVVINDFVVGLLACLRHHSCLSPWLSTST